MVDLQLSLQIFFAEMHTAANDVGRAMRAIAIRIKDLEEIAVLWGKEIFVNFFGFYRFDKVACKIPTCVLK